MTKTKTVGPTPEVSGDLPTPKNGPNPKKKDPRTDLPTLITAFAMLHIASIISLNNIRILKMKKIKKGINISIPGALFVKGGLRPF